MLCGRVLAADRPVARLACRPPLACGRGTAADRRRADFPWVPL